MSSLQEKETLENLGRGQRLALDSLLASNNLHALFSRDVDGPWLANTAETCLKMAVESPYGDGATYGWQCQD